MRSLQGLQLQNYKVTNSTCKTWVFHIWPTKKMSSSLPQLPLAQCLWLADIDECIEQPDICPRNRPVCVNVQGSYTCQLTRDETSALGPTVTCPAGYKFNNALQTCEGTADSNLCHGEGCMFWWLLCCCFFLFVISFLARFVLSSSLRSAWRTKVNCLTFLVNCKLNQVSHFS